MILNATSEDRIAFLYRFWIATISQRSNLFKTKIFITGVPSERGARGNCPRCPPLNPALLTTSSQSNRFWILEILKNVAVKKNNCHLLYRWMTSSKPEPAAWPAVTSHMHCISAIASKQCVNSAQTGTSTCSNVHRCILLGRRWRHAWR